MADTSPPPLALSEDRFKKAISVCLALVTLLATGIALAQSDASARDDRANRDSKRYATEALGRKVGGDARVNYDYNAAYQSWYELDLLAVSAANRGDEASARRYELLRDRQIALSPLLAPPYFDPATGSVDIGRYEADVYLVDITILGEKFVAASAVKEAWDAKANTYIVHLTLLAVALFLFGLATTISGPAARWIFAGTGTAISLVAAGWALAVWAQPVPDLRERAGAIEEYARGVGLAHQSRWEEAVAAYDAALQAAPDYARALAGRAQAHAALGELDSAAADYEAARAAGDKSANLAGELAWIYYLQGRFDAAADMNRVAIRTGQAELWIQFDLALSLLGAGQIDAAAAQYALGMDLAGQQVAAATSAGEEPPSYLWWSLDDAAAGLDDLLLTLSTGEGLPAPDQIANRDAVTAAAQEWMTRLKSLSVALEYTGRSPEGALSGQIAPFEFGQIVFDEQGNVEDYYVADTFDYGIDEVAVWFDYSGMRDGQEVLFKVYVDGEEDPSWRVIGPWDLGPSGSAQKLLSLAYTGAFVLGPGDYIVEMYVDSHLAQRGSFVIEP